MGNGKRLLFFDVLRIVSIAMIVFYHIAQVLKWSLFCYEPPVFHIFYLNPGVIGVAILIFVSGAMLEYSHPKLETVDEVSEFWVKRLFRIYPTFWMSMVIGLVCVPYLISTLYPFTIFLEFAGFNTWSGHWGGVINGMGWFVGLIVTLYFCYPFLSASIRKYPYLMLFLIAFVEIFSRYVLTAVWTPWPLGSYPDRFLPFCNFLEFGLGIFIVQQNSFPKWTYDNRWIWCAAELSFYVFLINYLTNMKILMIDSLPLYFIAVALLAWLMMLGDQKIQTFLKKVGGLS